MYKRTAQGWLKHFDFIFFDELTLQIAFILAYLIRHHDIFPYNNNTYLAIGIMLAVLDFLVATTTVCIMS